MRKLAIGLAMAALVGGCADHPKKWSLVGFDDDEAEVAMTATVEWCHRTSGAYCPTVTGGDNKIRLVDVTMEVNGIYAAGQYQAGHDLTADGWNEILILDRREQPNWLELMRRNILHEMGHAAGNRKDHLPFGNIMEFGETTPWHLTDADVEYALGH